MKRIGYLGDVQSAAGHADPSTTKLYDRLEIALRELHEQYVDTIVCVGDVVDGPGDIERTVALLRDHDVTTVRGKGFPQFWILLPNSSVSGHGVEHPERDA